MRVVALIYILFAVNAVLMCPDLIDPFYQNYFHAFVIMIVTNGGMARWKSCLSTNYKPNTRRLQGMLVPNISCNTAFHTYLIGED